MKIFYVKLDKGETEKLSRRELKALQSGIGRKIIDYVGKNIYNLSDTTVIEENSKPKFLNSDIQFSISHSNEIIAAAFDDFPLGLDIEYMKDRDFGKLSGHYGIKTKDKFEFYRQWTQLEAKIKIQSDIKNSYTDIFGEKYMLTIVSSNPYNLRVEFEEIKHYLK